MSDTQSAPVQVPPHSGTDDKPPPAQHNNRGNHHGGGRGGGGRGRGGPRGGERSHMHDRYDDDRDYHGRRKKPEVEHYKPGAFNSAKSRNDERDDYENRKYADSERSGSRGGRAHSGRGKNQHPVSNDIDATTDKVDKLSVDNNRERGGGKRNRNKKPEQPHYSAKKATTPTSNTDGVTTEPEVGNSKEGNNNGGGLNVVVGKPPMRAADDAKSEGGGSNTGTARRKQKNKNRLSADSFADGHDPQMKHGRNNDDNRHQHHQGGHRQNGYVDNNDKHDQSRSYHESSREHHHHHDGAGGRGRHSGGGRNKNRRSPSDPPRNSASPSNSNRDVSQQRRFHHDDSNRSSVDRNVPYNDRTSPGIPLMQRSYGGPNHNAGHRHQQHHQHHSQQQHHVQHQQRQREGYNRNSEALDWRVHREGSHDDYSNYQQQQPQSFDRWSNEMRSGRGLKSQPPKTVLPPRFQRQQQQHHQPHQGYDDSYVEVPHHTTVFRRRGSGRRSGDGDDTSDDRLWRRDSDVENGTEPDREQDLQFQSIEVEASAASNDAANASGPDEELSRVNDWSEEVEEEERLEQRAGSITPVVCASTTTSSPSERGGILRLPQQTQQQLGPDTGSWRSQTHDHQDASNPAWRGLQQNEAAQMRNDVSGFAGPQSGHYWQGSRPPRYLYDHRNPNKPIPASSYPGPSLMRPTSSNVGRFPADQQMRFAHPPPPAGAYRPPFPAMNQPPPTARPPLPPAGPEQYPVPMHSIFAMNMLFDTLVRNGGPQLVLDKWDTEMADCRKSALMAMKHLLETELVYVVTKDIEFLVWRICFYLPVESLKSILTPETSNVIQQNIVDLIDEGIQFYELMLLTLDQTYKIGLENFYDVLEPRSKDKMVRCILVSAQKCLLCLGDLARYKEQVQDSSNYGTARQYYQKASNIDTRNGRPFNQLAILAGITKRKFEAIYYHMRCLQSTSPIPSSAETLTLLFEDVRKKWETSEKRRMEEREAKRREADKEKEDDEFKGTKLRKEIWIRPEGGRRLHRTTSAREEDAADDDATLKELSTSDLNRRFNNSFLYLVGKLYTNINMDTFAPASELLLKEFKVLVSRSPLPIDSKRLVQIMALNMFIIEHTKVKAQDPDNYRTVAQNSALQLAFGMFCVLVERCNVLLKSFSPKPDLATKLDLPHSTFFNEEDLPTLLSAVKVWCDWIIGNNDVWFPVVSLEPFKQLAQLATHLEKLKPSIIPVLKTFCKESDLPLPNQVDCDMIKLEEDSILCGFDPWFRGLAEWKNYRRYVPKSIPPNLSQDIRRLDAINFCIDFLEGHEPPILRWSGHDAAHVCVIENRQKSEIDRIMEKGDILDESYSDEELDYNKTSKKPDETCQANDHDDIRRLKHRKEELERRRQLEEETRRMRNEILSEHVSVLLEVCPKFLVPDTNTFVDHLSELATLSSVGTFQLRVPAVVLNELDGLAKGTRSQHYQNKYSSPDHAAMVAENAKRAVTWLRDHPANTKCVTSLGNVLPSFTATTEEDSLSDGKNNDDVILDVCVNLSTTKNGDERRDNLRVVKRDVVLLTDDRNLKLKAHMTDVPVNAIPDFIRWAFPST